MTNARPVREDGMMEVTGDSVEPNGATKTRGETAEGRRRGCQGERIVGIYTGIKCNNVLRERVIYSH